MSLGVPPGQAGHGRQGAGFVGVERHLPIDADQGAQSFDQPLFAHPLTLPDPATIQPSPVKRMRRGLFWIGETVLALLIGVGLFMATYVALTEWRPELRFAPRAWVAAAAAAVLAVVASFVTLGLLSLVAGLFRSRVRR